MKRCPYCEEYLSDEAIQCKTCGEYLNGKERVDERCECGNLVAKLTDASVEIKCRRCKRIRVIPVDQIEERYRELLDRSHNRAKDDTDDRPVAED
jgi:phage FluMu protein Com